MTRAAAGAVSRADEVIYVCMRHATPVEYTVRRGDPAAPRECPDCAARTARRAQCAPCQATAP